MFDAFPTSKIDIVAPDGQIRHSTKAVFGKTIVIPDPSVTIFTGDEIRRTIPSGVEEAFEVLDPVFHQGHGGIPAHYQVSNRRKGTFPARTGGNFTIHVSGPNSRVNVNSTDHSRNFVADHNVFGDLQAAINKGVSEPAERELLSKLVASMQETAGDKPSFLKSYQNFMAAAANHMTVLAPFLPGLAALLGG